MKSAGNFVNSKQQLPSEKNKPNSLTDEFKLNPPGQLHPSTEQMSTSIF